jgi:7,8-dihydro-6-hydroxymethylpterin-pyrophosphokinase
LPTFKQEILGPIEAKLGRVRTADKYAPRTIDLDITIFDGQVLDADLWKRVYLALIFAELAPDLHNPQTRETLHETASRLAKQQHALQRLDITLE